MINRPENEDRAGRPANRWRCRNCGCIRRGGAPPRRCPVCHAPREMFDTLAPPPVAG